MGFSFFLGFVFGITLCVTANAQYLNPFINHCDGKADNTILKAKCLSYMECINETLVETPCPDGEAFQRSTMTCIQIGTGDTDCGLPVDCTGKIDAMYTDTNYGCQTFYHCINQVFYPNRIYCPPGLIFNFPKQWCDYVWNVPAPCGNRIG